MFPSSPSPGDLHDPGIKPGSSALQVDFLPANLPGKPLQAEGDGLTIGKNKKIGKISLH